MTDYAYVTQKDWDKAQKALLAVLPLVEANVPRGSTCGTAVDLRTIVREALRLPPADPLPKRYECGYAGCTLQTTTPHWHE
jgi:hypothetical protein